MHCDHDDNIRAHYKSTALRRLGWSLGITVLVMLVEVVGGWLSGSIALISDAGHMLTHSFAILIGISGIIIARRPSCHHRTFGLLRAEVLAALVNGLFLLLVSAWIITESVTRFFHPQEISTMQMLVIAGMGLIANVASILLLESSRHDDLNVRSVFIHMMGDAASSIAIVIAAVVIHYTRWVWIDPAISIGIALWIVVWAAGLLRDSSRILLEIAPKERNVEQIVTAMRARFPMIMETTNEHLWMISQDVVIFSMHVRIDGSQLSVADVNDWLQEAEHWLAEKSGIAESTLQVSFSEPPPADKLTSAAANTSSIEPRGDR